MPGKVKYQNLTESQKRKYLGDFYSIVASLKDYEEAKNFFKDLLTLSEMVMISRRIQIAKLLIQGTTYEDIQADLSVGKATITQVDKWLNNGFNGYKTVLKKHQNQKTIKKDYIPTSPFTLADLRRRYPVNFLLINMLMGAKNKH